MLSTLDVKIQDRFWAEVIFRLWSISRDIFPLFGRLLYNEEDAVKLFHEFLSQKESDNELDNSPIAEDRKHKAHRSAADTNTENLFGFDSEGWFLQN